MKRSPVFPPRRASRTFRRTPALALLCSAFVPAFVQAANATWTATNGCGTDTKSQPVGVLCLAPPCVNVDLNAPDAACVGTKVHLCGSVTNCSAGPETIEVKYGDQVQRFENVAPGASKNYCFEVAMTAY